MTLFVKTSLVNSGTTGTVTIMQEVVTLSHDATFQPFSDEGQTQGIASKEPVLHFFFILDSGPGYDSYPSP